MSDTSTPTQAPTAPTTAASPARDLIADLIDALPEVVAIDAQRADLDQRRAVAARSIGADRERYEAALKAHRAEVASALAEGRAPETMEPTLGVSDHERLSVQTTLLREAERLDVARSAAIARHGDSIDAEVQARAAALADQARDHVTALAEIAEQARALQGVQSLTSTARVTTEERDSGRRRDLTPAPPVDIAAVVHAVEHSAPLVRPPQPRRLGMDPGTLHTAADSAPEPAPGEAQRQRGLRSAGPARLLSGPVRSGWRSRP
ncbi:hypothetical protein [uncultured Nocardioides sp.]|uniref:hypothetical protein n=1 Tax=uncultured Nocardioides sp. TaxID=198441 RepID=UPI002625F95D|nr:hypothetical protein [uncultured Nocardioides sp.]